MTNFLATDLILNNDGSVYHLCLRPENLADTIIIVRDPQQLTEITRHFTTVDFTKSNREFISNTGYYSGKRITVLSTGIGTSNGDIVMNELDALANIDLKKREQFQVIKPLKIIRIASTSAIQNDLPLNSFCLSTHAIGFDNIMHFYKDCDRIIDSALTNAFIKYSQWPDYLSLPYFFKGSDFLISKFNMHAFPGITATVPGFFGPQGRTLRLKIADPTMFLKLLNFRFEEHRIMNIDMESSVYYGLGGLMGHEIITISTINGNNNDSQSFNSLIEMVLKTIVNL
jgi:uridine phosphorylase